MVLMSTDRQHRRPRVYLAGPLFSEAECGFNSAVTRRLEEWADVYLPQRDGGLMSEMINQGIESDIAACRVFKRDMDAIQQADYLIAVLDGRAIDEGVAFELGVAFSHAKRCVGLQTDSRRLASWGNNPMITGALEMVFNAVDDLVSWIAGEACDSRIGIPEEIAAEATEESVATSACARCNGNDVAPAD